MKYLAILCALPSVSLAGVIDGEILRQTGAGQFVQLNAADGFTVGADNFDTDHLYAFDEDQNIFASSNVPVDIGHVAAGQDIASHFVFFDSVDGLHYAYVDFDADVLGIAVLPHTLAATDGLANTAVTYLNTPLRGIENEDRVWIDPDNPHRVWMYWAGSSPGDYIRVFTKISDLPPMM
ncbi:MAG: hypothetical protein ACWA40_08465 [Planktomarina sp.]